MPAVPKWFYAVAGIALVWNLLGCAAFAMDLRLTPADVAALPAAQQQLYAARPVWSLLATGIAVVGGALGCLGLLLRRRWAIPVLVLSLAGIVVQDIAMFILVDGLALAGAMAGVLQGIVLVAGVLLVVLGRSAARRGWLA